MNEAELQIMLKIREIFASPFLDKLMYVITLFGEAGGFFIALSLSLIFFTKKYRKAGCTAALALLIGVIFGNAVLKNIIARVRPYDLPNGIVPALKNLPTDWSFPSGHTLASFETGVGITVWNKKIGIPVLVLGVFISLSRIYLGVHYPTDVIGGALLGTAFALISKYAVEKAYEIIPPMIEKKRAK